MSTNHKLVCARAARYEFDEAYSRGIGDYRRSRQHAVACGRYLLQHLPDGLPLRVLSQLHDDGVVQLAWDGVVTLDNRAARASAQRFRVLARKRPLQPRELEAGAYDSMSVEDANSAVIVHDGRVHRDGRTLYMSHSRFCLDRVFGEAAGNDAVYAEAARPLLEVARAGGRSTLLLFGQTGTGKTHTARGCLDGLAADLFAMDDAVHLGAVGRVAAAPAAVDGSATLGMGISGEEDGADGAVVMLYVYEISGTRGGREGVFDLLSDRKQVKSLTGEDGQVHVRGARGVRCSQESELRSALASAFALRSSETTERNDASSRSHAVIELQLLAPSGGVLRVVDLAGSERNFETQMHTRKMAERGGHINYSLLMLKECARLMHRNRQRLEDGADAAQLAHIPFRSSRLTHLLQRCFDDPAHHTIVLTTLSPSPTDIEHSLNSLQHVGMMRCGLSNVVAAADKATSANSKGFEHVQGRGHALHSKLQDSRAAQLKLHAFGMVTEVGGSLMKRYEPENVKIEEFINPRWHRELNVVAEQDLWVLRDADAEAVQILKEWREEQWESRKAHNIVKWDPGAVGAFVRSLGMADRVRLPSAMTGAQLWRLGRRGLNSLCNDEEAAQLVYEALMAERAAAREVGATLSERNAKISALGAHKMHVAHRGPQGIAAAGVAEANDAPVGDVTVGASSAA